MEENVKKNGWDTTKIILAITAGVAVLALVGLLVWMVVSGMISVNVGKPQETEPQATTLGYTATDEVAIAANGNIVATLGDLEFTNGQLQVHYWSQIYNFISTYSAYLSYFGLDLTKPLSEQECMIAESGTWEEFFLEEALATWAQMAGIVTMAEEEGFTLSEEDKEYLATTIENLKTSATTYGFKDLDEMVDTEMGKGTTAEDYIAYVEMDYLCSAYYSYLVEKNMPTEAQLEEYYAANQESVESSGYGKTAGKLVDVRHILIKPEGGTLNEDGVTYTYTDAQWEAARQKAQVVYDLWQTGAKDEDYFAELAAKNSADGSASNGGLLSNTPKGKTVTEFNDWIFTEGREYGDHGLVKTVYGYHIMFFVDSEEAWIRYCTANYTSEVVSTLMENFAKDYTIQTNYDLIAIGQVDLAG